MTVEENKELVRRMVEKIWNGHDLDRLGEFISDGFLEESSDHFRQFLAAFPDVHITIEDLIGEADKVVGRLGGVATNTGPFAGQSPTGKEIKIDSIRIWRIADHKIVESWAMQDRLGLMEQLGLIQPTGDVAWASGEED